MPLGQLFEDIFHEYVKYICNFFKKTETGRSSQMKKILLVKKKKVKDNKNIPDLNHVDDLFFIYITFVEQNSINMC